MITAFISCLWKCKYNCKRGRWWRHDSLQFLISYHQANLSSLHWNYTHRGGFTSLRLVKHGRNGFLNPLCEIPGVVIDLQGLHFFACLLSFFLLLSYILFLWSAANKNKRLLPFHQELSAIETAKPFGVFRFFGFLFCFCFLSHHVALGTIFLCNANDNLSRSECVRWQVNPYTHSKDNHVRW